MSFLGDPWMGLYHIDLCLSPPPPPPLLLLRDCLLLPSGIRLLDRQRRNRQKLKEDYVERSCAGAIGVNAGTTGGNAERRNVLAAIFCIQY